MTPPPPPLELTFYVPVMYYMDTVNRFFRSIVILYFKKFLVRVLSSTEIMACSCNLYLFMF